MNNKKVIIMCLMTIASLIFSISFFVYAFYQRAEYDKRYKAAAQLIDVDDYGGAIEILDTIRDYSDVEDLLVDLQKKQTYVEAMSYLETKQYLKAVEKFSQIEEYNDSHEKIYEAKYNLAIEYFNSNNFTSAKKIFIELEDYQDSIFYLAQIDIKLLEQTQEIIYQKASDFYYSKDYLEAYNLFTDILNYKDSRSKASECKMWNLSSVIITGLHHSAAIKNDGKIICTDDRYNFYGWDNVISISGFGGMIIGLNEDGTVELEGHPDVFDIDKTDIYYKDVSDWENIIQISSGQQHIVGLKSDGTVVSKGILSDPDWENIELIAAGWGYTVGLDSNNNIHVDGNISKILSTEIASSIGKWNDIISIDAGGANSSKVNGKGHIVGLYEDGTVIAIGDNHYGQCNVEGWTDIVAIAAGDFHTVGLKSDGTVVATDPLNTRELPSTAACNVYGKEWTDIVAIAAGCGTTLGLKRNGTIVSCGYNLQNQIPNNNDKDWANIRTYQY